MKRNIARITALFLLSISLTQTPSAAEEGKTVQIEKPWARASILKSHPAAAYLTIINRSGEPDRLMTVSSPVAEKVSVHLSEMTNGVMRMKPVHSLPLESGAQVTLKPGGLHLMLLKLRNPLREGDKLPLTLTFEVAGKIDVQATVLGVGAKGPE